MMSEEERFYTETQMGLTEEIAQLDKAADEAQRTWAVADMADAIEKFGFFTMMALLVEKLKQRGFTS